MGTSVTSIDIHGLLGGSMWIGIISNLTGEEGATDRSLSEFGEPLESGSCGGWMIKGNEFGETSAT